MVFVSQDDYTRAVADVTQGRRTGFKEGRLVKAKRRYVLSRRYRVGIRKGERQ
jgi:hypothetical protein